MRLTLDIPDNIAAQLKSEADNMGTDEKTFVVKMLERWLNRLANKLPLQTEQDFRARLIKINIGREMSECSG